MEAVTDSIEIITSLSEAFQGETFQLGGNPLNLILIFGGLAMAPFLILGLTCFVKLSVVFSILRNAIGAGQVPSVAVSTLLTLALSVHIMSPVVEKSLAAASGVLARKTSTSFGSEMRTGKAKPDLGLLKEVLEAGATAFSAFLLRHSGIKEREFFRELAIHRQREKTAPDCQHLGACSSSLGTPKETLLTLIPAFVISELRAAFAIGFTIFLPFLVIDLVIANLLVGMGMVMVSPLSIALPFKLLLFFACDGWFLLCRSLVLSY